MVIKVGDTVLAYHGRMIYDAKVLKVDNGQGAKETTGDGGQLMANTQFYVHYQGWAKKWDEWIRHDRVLEDTLANRILQQQAKEDVVQAKKEKKLTIEKQTSSGGMDSLRSCKSPFKRLKRNVENDYEECSGLKEQNQTEKMKPNVNQIIKTCLEFKKSKVRNGQVSDKKEYTNVEGIMEGVQSYFDRALSSILLYRMEHRQYQELRQEETEGVPLLQIYDAEHLIRLFVRLPVLLASSNISPRALLQIQARRNDFFKFVQNNASAWFVTEYEAASEKIIYMITTWETWILVIVLFYAAFQLHFLPKGLSKAAVCVYFYPTWPLRTFHDVGNIEHLWTLMLS
ncbi:unnamed protein product [Peronospora belbahrii]|uniref:Chromatin modification-related protein EAF3 n=1 Tax=Peronospora belbahrii TaxID=622444 RepID=A0ABN8D2F7_9STRA|nr:unnamed protein product [Peronospora belbahrii]